MRNDQIFVLMLVVLLPMSGCFDGAIGDVEADDDSDLHTENEYQDVIRTVYIEPSDVVNITLNGNTTLELVSGHRTVITNTSGSDTYWYTDMDLFYFMHCDGYEFPNNKFRFYGESLYAANLPDTICYLELDTTSTNSNYEFYYIFSFKEHPLDSL